MTDVQTKIKARCMATPRIREVVVTAIEGALNAAVAEHWIKPDKIIAVIFQPGKAIGDYEAKYRLIYRT